MRALCILLLWGAPAFAGAQQELITEVQRTPGVRQLHLQGLFTDAGTDSVQLELFHDGDILYRDSYLGSWSLELGTFDYYTVLFTDGQGRQKRLHVMELSDDQIEFVPPIEVDFSVRGNLLLLKPRDRKPDFTMYDTGTSRR